MEIDVEVIKSVIWSTVCFQCPKCDHENEVCSVTGAKVEGKKECWYCGSTLTYKEKE